MVVFFVFEQFFDLSISSLNFIFGRRWRYRNILGKNLLFGLITLSTLRVDFNFLLAVGL